MIMKKTFLFIAIYILVAQFSKATTGNLTLDASVTFATFTTPEQPYVEIYLHVLGASVKKIMVEDSLYQSKVEVVTLFKADSAIVKFDKYIECCH